MHQGFLSEVCRISGLIPAGTGHRFLIQSVKSQEPINLPPKYSCHSTIVFDGSTNFLKWRDFYTKHNWIVVLDHTDANFKSAVDQVNQDYIYRSTEIVEVAIPPIPSGIEMMMFGRDL
jgi:hypothetical protein